MGPLSKYWEILRIDPGDEGCGYRKQTIPLASEFFYAEFSDLVKKPVAEDKLALSSTEDHRTVQRLLHNQFMDQSPTIGLQHRAKAGLCLRGYVSHAILRACKKLASKFSGMGQLTYQDLLPYVLNDDGEMQIILDQDANQQLILNGSGHLKLSTYELFSVEVLRKFKPNAERVVSLDNWVHLQTRQNQALKGVLSERGFCKLSDWALLNQARAPQLERFTPRERYIVEAFHSVYRRDKRKQQRTHKPNPAPTLDQLNEMQLFLQDKGILIIGSEQLNIELKQIAQRLRQYAIWSSNGAPQAEPLEDIDPCASSQREFCDPNSINDLDQIVQKELREFCYQQLVACLDWAIDKGIYEHSQSLVKRPRYAVFASKVTTILTLVYYQGQSQSKIAAILGMKNQSQVSRVLNPTTLLKRIRYWTVEHFSQMLLTEVCSLNLAAPDPDYLKNLMQHIEAFVDAEAFQTAFAELKTAKNRSMNSLYAQRLRHYLEK